MGYDILQKSSKTVVCVCVKWDMDRVMCPSPEFFLIFGSESAIFVQKFFCVQAKWGIAQWPPKYATACDVLKFWEISDDILKMVQDRDIVTTEDDVTVLQVTMKSYHRMPQILVALS